MDVLTPEQRKRNMRAIKNKNTKIEILLAKALTKKGLRYRRNNALIFGKPDFTFRSLKIAVFCDSEYFHGKDWEINKQRIKTNTEFWQRKIQGNINRDKIVNDTLFKSGWKVIRFWGEDIKKNTDFCADSILNEIEKRKTEIQHNKVKA
ncbi:MAG: very short patch repair endonuclease [Saprospiraceae bacterium]